MTATDLCVDALAAYRLTRLVVKDSLTDGVRLKLRRAVMGSDEPDPVVVKLDTLASCPWCVGFWCAVGVVTARRITPRLWGPLAEALAFSTVTGFLSLHDD